MNHNLEFAKQHGKIYCVTETFKIKVSEVRDIMYFGKRYFVDTDQYGIVEFKTLSSVTKKGNMYFALNPQSFCSRNPQRDALMEQKKQLERQVERLAFELERIQDNKISAEWELKRLNENKIAAFVSLEDEHLKAYKEEMQEFIEARKAEGQKRKKAKK